MTALRRERDERSMAAVSTLGHVLVEMRAVRRTTAARRPRSRAARSDMAIAPKLTLGRIEVLIRDARLSPEYFRTA